MSYLVAFLLALPALAWLFKRRRTRLSLPPGPKGWPIVGNINDLGHKGKHSWLHYADWISTYGDIVYLETFGKPTVILNSVEAATELLEKRSSNYSDRPTMVMANDLMKWDWDFAHMRYSEHWRIHRKTFHQYFQPREMENYQSIQYSATTTMLQCLLDSPEDFGQHVRHHGGSIILKVVYGYEAKAQEDDYVKLADKAMKSLSQAVHAGSFLVDFIPALKYVPVWLPGAKFKRQAKVWSKYALAMRDSPFGQVKSSIADGTAIPSFVTRNLERMQRTDSPDSAHMEKIIKNCAGIAYLAMILYPDIQTRAQTEIDTVIGRSRLPNFSDRPALPYIEAILSETLRWMPVTPLGVPHASIRGDEYKGYYIPPGSTIIANAWAILHDPRTYPEPSVFKPERFMTQDLPPDPANYAFGFGRRICPGRYLALNTAWLGIVSILFSFSIKKALDDNGNEITPVADCTDGTVVHPIPFKCIIKPRSYEVVDLIKHGYDTTTS